MKQTESTHKQKQGFSLIELLVVMAIIAILMGIVLGVSGSIQRKAAEARARAQIADLMTEIELYHSDEGQYPPSQGDTLQMHNSTPPLGFVNWYEKKYPGTRFDQMAIGTDNGVDFLADPWGKALVYKYDYASSPFIYLIGSTGPDGKNGGNGSTTFGDGDDITNRNGAL